MVKSQGRNSDKAQLEIVVRFERLVKELEQSGYNKRFFRLRRGKPPKGIYLWGGVGRGKTWLMDFLYENIPGNRKYRYHFHRFMQEIHQRLAAAEKRSNPLQRVARDIAADARLLCLDELNVIDIGDALILAGLIRALIDYGVVLVTTTNIPPNELYKNGIQRSSFLPAIELLKQHLEVIELEGHHDYRRDLLERTGVYHYPLDEFAEICLSEEFIRLASGRVESDGVFHVLNRKIPYQKIADSVIWFDFKDLCGPHRSQIDYIEIGRDYHTVFISNIPCLDGSQDDQMRRFILLVDEFYDRKVKLVASAEAEPERLYCGEQLAFDYARTVSRLREMQTHKYLNSTHLG